MFAAAVDNAAAVNELFIKKISDIVRRLHRIRKQLQLLLSKIRATI